MDNSILPLREELERVKSLRAELDARRPLSPDMESRVMQKLRLDWNYHSAKIEGGELTFGETKALILFGITAGQKSLKDHLEMKGHNEAIHFLIDLARKEEPLTEHTIRGLHRLILGDEPFRSEAQTVDGQQTSRWITPGRYKREPNHVETATGEIFRFASPEETPAKMQELVSWYRAEEGKPENDLVLLAAEFHYRFVRIHPFDDGNGRMARLLMNFILMRHGFPPAVIRSETKEEYFRVLQAADAGEIEPFVAFVAHEVARSLEIMVRAAKGEDIEDENDVYKEIALLKKRLESDDENLVKVPCSREAVINICLHSLVPLFGNLVNELSHLDQFFRGNLFQIRIDSTVLPLGLASKDREDPRLIDHLIGIYVKDDNRITLRNWFQENFPDKNYFNLKFIYKWAGFLKSGEEPINMRNEVLITFDKYRYIVEVSDSDTEFRVEKRYHVYLSEQEQKKIARAALRVAFERMEQLLPPDIKEEK